MGNKGGHACVAESGEFDSIIDALRHRERRRLLVELYDNDPLDYREFVGDMGEGGTDTELQLVHMHLPKLDDMGYIAWDRDSGEIGKGAKWNLIGPVIQLFDNNRERLPSGAF